MSRNTSRLMSRHTLLPVAMGALMAPMMLWMLHGDLMGSGGGGAALKLVVFAGAHVVIIGGALLLGALAMRRFPGVARLAARVHRPSLRHLGLMLAGAGLSGLVVHLAQHGGAL